MQDSRLQGPAEGQRLRRVLVAAARNLLDLAVQILVQLEPQARQIRAARGENRLAIRIVRQRVQEVLERQVRVPPGCRFAVRDGEDDFQGLAEHRYAGSITACSG
jgi:hypothetical protein